MRPAEGGPRRRRGPREGTWLRIDAGLALDGRFQSLSERDQRRYLTLACLRALDGVEAPSDEAAARGLGIPLENWLVTKSNLGTMGLIGEGNVLPGWGGVVEPPEEVDDIPCQAMADAFNEIMPEGIPRVKTLTDTYKRQIGGCWRADKERRSLEWWREYFGYCARSEFLMGDGDKKWSATFGWLTKRGNLEKVLAETYHRPARAPSGPRRTRGTTGEAKGPAGKLDGFVETPRCRGNIEVAKRWMERASK
jgi:hypothetical protein